jgi:hypothetical protein
VFVVLALSPVWERVTSGGGWIAALKTLSLQNASSGTYRGLFRRKLSFRKKLREIFVFSRAVHLDESLLPGKTNRAFQEFEPLIMPMASGPFGPEVRS